MKLKIEWQLVARHEAIESVSRCAFETQAQVDDLLVQLSQLHDDHPDLGLEPLLVQVTNALQHMKEAEAVLRDAAWSAHQDILSYGEYLSEGRS